jgi:PAS domain S-box-containing protein
MHKSINETLAANSIIANINSDNTHYRSIIENNSFYVIKTDLEGNYSYMNPFFCQQFALKAEKWLGKPSLDLIVPDDHQTCIDTITSCFMMPESSHWVILRKPHFTGIVSTQWEFKLALDAIGNPMEIVCIGHDITSLVLRQQELQNLVDITADQNKKLLNFTYIISHNIRSHIANIIGVIELNDIGTDEEKKISWDLIKKSVGGLDITVKNLNEIINIQTNTNLPLKKVEIKNEVIGIVNSIKVLFDKAETNITYNFDSSASWQTNPAYFQSIILNLLTNSLKYKALDRPLKINLSTTYEDNYHILIFQDNGLGINLERNGDKVFGMYKTFHGNADAKGMGLFIVKNQIEALGGKIEIDSEVNKFTTFRIFFPDTLT